MQFGICTDLENAPAAAAAGFDYIEVNVQQILQPESGEEQFAAMLARIESCGLPVQAANCFIPPHLKITGPEVRMDALTHYVAVACQRAQRAGIKTIVFGSGGARNIPDGFLREEAREQLVTFGKMVAAAADRFDLMIAVEPLNRRECNVLNTVGEGADYVREVDHPNFRLLVDAYHWALENETTDDLLAVAGLLQHAHISTYKRLPPAAEEADFAPFFRALQEGRYDNRLSVEANWADIALQARPALEELRRCVVASRNPMATQGTSK